MEIQSLLDAWSEAVRKKDIEQLMALYAPQIVYYDVVPPLRIVGAEAVRRNFLRWFDLWSSGIGSQNRELQVSTCGDLAAAHMLHRTSGTLKPGREVDYWVRVSIVCQKIDSAWRIQHEHVSLPGELASGRVVMNLQP